MIKILSIALKDVRSIFRTPSALVMMLAAPLVIATLLGAAFGGNEGFSFATTEVVVVNLDEGNGETNIGETLTGVLESDDLRELFAVERLADEQEARARVDEGEAAVAVLIPAGFSSALGSAEAGASSEVVLYKDPTRDLGPGIARSILQSIVDGLNATRAAAATAVALRMQEAAESGQAPDQAELRRLAEEAAHAMNDTIQGATLLEIAARPPAVAEAERTKDVSVIGGVLVGMMVFFMFFAASNAARTILDEDAEGTLPRMFTTPTPRGLILAGKMVSVFLTVLVQSIVLLAAGRLLFGVDWGGILPVVLLTAAGVATAAGLAVLLVSAVRTPAQAGAISSGVFLVLALVGGNFVGGMPPGTVFDTIRRFTPNGWLLVGWETTMRGGSVLDALLPAGVALAFGAVTFFVGVLLFRRRYA